MKKSFIDNGLIVRIGFLSLTLFLLFATMYFAASVLIPLALAALIALILFPVADKLEHWGFNRVFAILLCLILVLAIVSGMLLLLYAQIMRLIADLPELTKQIIDKLNQLQVTITQYTQIEPENQIGYAKDQLERLLQSSGSIIQSTVFATTTTFAMLGLIPIYIFFFLFYRDKFQTFMYMVAGEEQKTKVASIMGRIKEVVQSYIAGLLIVIIILACLNTIGLTVLGIRYALFFGIVAALLTIIPYIGVFLGSLLPMTMALLTKDSLWYPIGVLLIFGFIQFLEGNFITPNIVGSKVSINPLAAIVALIVGGAVWGIVGMVLFIPYLGMLKVIFDNIDGLRPFGYLLGTEGVENHSVSLRRTWYNIKSKLHRNKHDEGP